MNKECRAEIWYEPIGYYWYCARYASSNFNHKLKDQLQNKKKNKRFDKDML